MQNILKIENLKKYEKESGMDRPLAEKTISYSRTSGGRCGGRYDSALQQGKGRGKIKAGAGDCNGSRDRTV